MFNAAQTGAFQWTLLSQFSPPLDSRGPFLRFDTLVLSEWYVCSWFILRASVVGCVSTSFESHL